MKKSIFHVTLVCILLACVSIVWGAESFLPPPPKNVPKLLVLDLESGSEKCQEQYHDADKFSVSKMKACFSFRDYGWGNALKEAFDEIDAITAGNCHGLTCDIQARSTFGVAQAYHRAFGRESRMTLLALQKRPKALRRLYLWAIPHVKAKFHALSEGEQKEYMSILQHARAYAHTFDYKKEKAYYMETCVRKERCWVFKIKDSDSVSTYRYVETFIFRRVRDGMSIKDIRSWIDRLIRDLK